MNDDNNLGSTLAAATCALLGASAAAPATAEELQRWSFDTALLYYGESDDRVQDVSATIGAQRAFDDERRLIRREVSLRDEDALHQMHFLVRRLRVGVGGTSVCVIAPPAQMAIT